MPRFRSLIGITVLLSIDPDTMVGDLPFGLNNKQLENVFLADADGKTVDTVAVDGNKAVVSYCRLPDAIGAWDQCEQTFGAVNQLAATACGNDKLEDPERCDGPELGGQTCAGLKLGFDGGTLGCTLRCRYDAKQCTTSSKLVINELEFSPKQLPAILHYDGTPITARFITQAIAERLRAKGAA